MITDVDHGLKPDELRIFETRTLFVEHPVLQIKVRIIRYRYIRIVIIIFPGIEYSRKHNNNNIIPQYNGVSDGGGGVSDDVSAHGAVWRRLYIFGLRDKTGAIKRH